MCAIAGEDDPSASRPLTAPNYQTSVFDVESLELVDGFSGENKNYVDGFTLEENGAVLQRSREVVGEATGGTK